MKKKLCVLYICVLILALLLGACAWEPASESHVDPVADEVPVLNVINYYCEYIDDCKISWKQAVLNHVHYESEESRKLALELDDKVLNCQILRVEKLTDQLWEVERFMQTEIGKEGYYDVDYVGMIDGRWWIMLSPRQIPDTLKEGVEIEPYEAYGPSIIPPEDIVGGLGEHVIGTQPAQP